MPGANEVLGCTRKYFLFIPQNFRRPFYQLSNFRTIRSLDAPSRAAPFPVTTFFSSFFAIYLHFLHKTGPLDAPQGGCPGPSHRPHPLCTSLLQFPFLQNQLLSNETSAKCKQFKTFLPRCHENCRTSPHNYCPKIT